MKTKLQDTTLHVQGRCHQLRNLHVLTLLFQISLEFSLKTLNCEAYKLDCMKLFSSADFAIFRHVRNMDIVEV